MTAIEQWLLDHCYAADDIVLGYQGLTEAQIESLSTLLDAACPSWREFLRAKGRT